MTGKLAEQLRQAAEQGDLKAQFALGLMLAAGDDILRDWEQGLKWIRAVAERGHTDAQKFLAVMYAEGEGVPQDLSEALKWYNKAMGREIGET